MKTRFCCTPVDGWKRRFLKTISSRCWIPVNAHAPIKGSTVCIRYCVFVRTGKNYSKTRRVDAEFFEEGEKIVLKKMDSCGQSLILEEMQNQSKHSHGNNISDGRLENLACISAKNPALSLFFKCGNKSRSLSISPPPPPPPTFNLKHLHIGQFSRLSLQTFPSRKLMNFYTYHWNPLKLRTTFSHILRSKLFN